MRELSVWTFRAVSLSGGGLLLLLVARLRGIPLGVPRAHTLDALVFSSPQAPPIQVYQGGQLRLDGSRLCRPGAEPGLREQLAQDFARTMGELWA
jgi:hypothetical protein